MWAITVRQPWAWAIIDGHKNVENRTRIGQWRKLAGQRIALHSSLRWSRAGASSPLVLDAYDRAHGITPTLPVPLHRDAFAGGVVLGTVQVVDVHDAGDCDEPACWPWGEHDHRPGEACHLTLTDPHRLYNPIRVGGRLGPWQLPDDVADQVLTGKHT